MQCGHNTSRERESCHGEMFAHLLKLAMHAAGPVTGQQKTDHGTKWQMKTVGDHDELVSGSGDPGNWRTLRRFAVPLCPITTNSPPSSIVRTNQRISPSCLTLNLPPPRPQRALTSNSSSTMPWTNTRTDEERPACTSLAAQLQSCDSPAAILAILHQQVQGSISPKQ
ncbi:hypothetical protein BJV77DRAFT_301103 [Russula vinacea]|nr:hypothetical protein BJV77DRAFT_301103 [Russula vinacea]